MKRKSCHHIETSQLIYSADQSTGFYMMVTLTFNELRMYLPSCENSLRLLLIPVKTINVNFFLSGMSILPTKNENYFYSFSSGGIPGQRA